MATATRKGTTSIDTPNDLEVVIRRSFDAPRRLVYQAWTSCAHILNWMGPSTMPVTACDIDLRVGGTYRFASRAPDGTEVVITGTYREIVPPERVVSTDSWGEPWPETTATMTFVEEDGLTTMTISLLYPTKEARDAAIATGMSEGMSMGFDRLDAYLPTLG
jgi:uncharacterized protein YndB with AHSA1/START domain